MGHVQMGPGLRRQREENRRRWAADPAAKAQEEAERQAQLAAAEADFAQQERDRRRRITEHRRALVAGRAGWMLLTERELLEASARRRAETRSAARLMAPDRTRRSPRPREQRSRRRAGRPRSSSGPEDGPPGALRHGGRRGWRR